MSIDPLDIYADEPDETDTKKNRPAPTTPVPAVATTPANAEPATPKQDPATPTPAETTVTKEAEATDTAAKSEAGPVEADEEAVKSRAAAAKQEAVFARRRLIRNLVLTGVIALVAWAGGQYALGSTTGPAKEAVATGTSAAGPGSAANPDQAKTAEQLLTALAAEAGVYRGKNGTYRGFAAEGVKVAANDNTIILATTVDGRYWYTGVVPGKAITVREDPDGTATSDDLIADTQRALDAAESTADATSSVAAAADLRKAAEAAQLIASQNIVGGKASFRGVTETYVDGVEIVANTGPSLILRSESAGVCVVSEVTATAVGEPIVTDCPQ